MPSRKSRGLISTVASWWIGWPSSLTVNVTSAWSPYSSTPVTSPTFTPAIRTGEFGVSVAAFSKTARTVWPFGANGNAFVIFAKAM